MLLMILPSVCLIIGIVLMCAKKAVFTGKILFTIGFTALTVIGTFLEMLILLLSQVNADFYLTMAIIIAVILFVMILGIVWGFARKRKVYLPFICALVICVLVIFGFNIYQGYIDDIPTVSDSTDLLIDYAPYYENTLVATLDEEATLKLNEDLPKMDGATALYPVYSAFARAVYPKEAIDKIVYTENGVIRRNECEALSCNTTTDAYYNIVTKDADIIFVAGPSYEQEEFAKENGVELIYTPIGKEAFVFFVNSKNPIGNITISQIRDIYSGKITEWNELGIKGLGEIKAFQRDEGSGSQTALIKLMGDTELMAPIEEDVIAAMGGIISKTADYKNYKNAIGYSFRYYANEMVNNNQIKLLNIENTEPNTENIENGSYPIASEFYAVTRADADENTQLLLQWILSEQGQELIEKTGYTPIK